MAKGPVRSGARGTTPPKGTNGPGDGGKNDGSKHFAHPNLPKPVKNGVQPGKR